MSKPRRRHHGLKKCCVCPPKEWSRCPHPWHFGFCWNGQEYRYSLHMVAKCERTYVTRAGCPLDERRASIP